MVIFHGTCPLGYKRDESKKVIVDETTKKANHLIDCAIRYRKTNYGVL